MATQITATATGTRPAARFGFREVTILAVVLVAAVIALAAWTQIDSSSDITVESMPYGDGYPLHGGLAGPSRVSVFDMSPITNGGSFAPGYPLHGGLAGPSRASVTNDAGSFAPGYPLRGGLAGPSRVAGSNQAGGFAPGYPLHGGLAGPSQVDEGE